MNALCSVRILQSHPLGKHHAATAPLGACALLFALAGPTNALQSTTLVSLNAAGTSAQDACLAAGMTPDGRYMLMTSGSTDLDPTLPTPSVPSQELWIRDRLSGTNELVSISLSGGYSGGISGTIDVSADGRFVVFQTSLPNLVAGDTNANNDVFLRDRLNGVTTRESVAWDGSQASGTNPQISSNGRYMLFVSRAGNVVPGVLEGNAHLYRRDLELHTNEVAALYSEDGAISSDGHLVAFATPVPLLPQDTNGLVDVYVRDFTSGTLTLESVASGGEPANGSSYLPRISDDGAIVAFASTASNLIATDTNARDDLFVRNRLSGVVSVASRHSDGTLIEHNGFPLTIFQLSASGGHVAFFSDATNLIDADMNGDRGDVFIHDVESGETQVVSVDSNGQQPQGLFWDEVPGGISADGQLVQFQSVVALAPDDTSSHHSVFVHDRSVPTPRAFCFGIAAACPCNNAGPVGHGCANSSTTLGARLQGQGNASVTSDTFLLRAFLLSPGGSALFFQGTARVAGGQGAVFGDGLRCAGGTTTRLVVKTAQAGTGYADCGAPVGDTPISVRGQIPSAGGTYHYQVWYRNAATWCTPAAFNLSNGLTMTWRP